MKAEQIKDFAKKYWVELCTFFLVLIVFLPSIPYGFQADWDDAYYVSSNPYLSFTWENICGCFSRSTLGLLTPLTTFSFMVDYLVWGGNEFAGGYRLTNILFHCGAAVLFIRILKHLGIRDGLVFACVLFWAIQPQRLESVVWISERKDVLSMFFALFSFLVFMKAPGDWKRILISFFLFLLSLLAKPSAIGLPMVAAVYICYWKPEKFKWKILLSGVILATALSVCLFWYLKIRLSFLPMPSLFSVVFHNALFYIVNGIFPWETNPCYPYVDWHDFWLVPAFLFLCVFTVYLARSTGFTWKKLGMTVLAFSVVYAALFAPFTGALKFNATDYADRYSYFPNLAVWAFLGYFLEQVFREKSYLIPRFRIAGILLFLFAAGSVLWYMPFWKDSQTLARWAVYSDDLPNDRFVIIHAKTGFITQDPSPITESLEYLKRKQQYPAFPREHKNIKKGRDGTITVFDISAEILKGNFPQASVKIDRLISDSESLLLIDKDIYEDLFKYLVMQMFVITKDEARLAAFEKWGKNKKDSKGKTVQDYAVTAFMKYHRKDYLGAISDWRELLKEKKNSPDILENIRRAEEKLKQQ